MRRKQEQAFRSLRGSRLAAEYFPLYVMAVTGSLFTAMLLDMKAPKFKRVLADPTTSWPYHAANLRAIFDFITSTLSACIDGAGTNYQCSYCGKGWNSLGQSSKQRPKVTRLSCWEKTIIMKAPFMRLHKYDCDGI